MSVKGFNIDGAIQKYDYWSLENAPEVVAAIEELNNKLDQIIADFDVSTQEAVNNWLEAHPEVTTTVQDGALTKQKFSDATKLETINFYVTPQMYGAKADGITDDVEAFEEALNSGKQVFIPKGDYYLSRAINNPEIITIFGVGYDSNIKCNSSFLENKISRSTLSQFRIFCNQTNSITAFPSEVYNSVIYKVYGKYFYSIFNRISNTSVIDSCSFSFIQNCFCNSITDSFIINNYINAPKFKNPQTVCFKGAVHSAIIGNYIDYMYKVFACTATAMKALTVTGNVFDVCFCIFYDCVSGTTFTGNTIANLKKRSDWDVSGNTEMNTEPWCIIKRSKGESPISNSTFASNSFQAYTSFDMYMDCKAPGYPTNDILIDEFVPSDKINFYAYKSGNPRDFENITIRPMLKREVESLPSATLSSNARTFNHDEVIYDGNLYMNINGTWKQLTNV